VAIASGKIIVVPSKIKIKMKLLWLAAFCAASVAAQDEAPRIIGGRKKRRKFGSDGLILMGDETLPSPEQKARMYDAYATGKPLDVSDTQFINADHVEKQTERKPSMVKLPGRDEYLLLPDRESVLNFKSFRDFATEDDLEEQEAMRNEAWWGRLYVEGMPFSVQYFRGHFGSSPKKGPIRLINAEPLSMCDERQIEPILTNANAIGEFDGDVYILATRGLCTFGEKAGECEAGVERSGRRAKREASEASSGAVCEGGCGG
jgi:hypothetical protein